MAIVYFGLPLIMLILIGTVPTAYALNHAVGGDQIQVFATASQRAQAVLAQHGGAGAAPDARATITEAVRQRTITPPSLPALNALIGDITRQVTSYGSLAKVPHEQTSNVRNDMYLASELPSLIAKRGEPQLTAPEKGRFGSAINPPSTAPPNSSPPGSRWRWRLRWDSVR